MSRKGWLSTGAALLLAALILTGLEVLPRLAPPPCHLPPYALAQLERATAAYARQAATMTKYERETFIAVAELMVSDLRQGLEAAHCRPPETPLRRLLG